MKKLVPHRTNEELRHYPIKNVLNGWFFRIDEVSQGYYRVEGVDRWGHSVSRDGIDPDLLINECKADILELFPDN